jgi:hypothetical protein
MVYSGYDAKARFRSLYRCVVCATNSARHLARRHINGVTMAGHRGALAGTSNQVEFYPDLGYVLVVLGNADGDAPEVIVQRARGLITSSPHKIDPR